MTNYHPISPSSSSNSLNIGVESDQLQSESIINNLRETENKLKELEKENFDLKLKLFHINPSSKITTTVTQQNLDSSRIELEDKNELILELTEKFNKLKSKYDKTVDEFKQYKRACHCDGGRIPIQKENSIPLVQQVEVVKEIPQSHQNNNNTHIKESYTEVQVPFVKEIVKPIYFNDTSATLEYEKQILKANSEIRSLEHQKLQLQGELENYRRQEMKSQSSQRDLIAEFKDNENELSRKNRDLQSQLKDLQELLHQSQSKYNDHIANLNKEKRDLLEQSNINNSNNNNDFYYQQQLNQKDQKIQNLMKEFDQIRNNYKQLQSLYEKSKLFKSQYEDLLREKSELLLKIDQLDQALQDKDMESRSQHQQYEYNIILQKRQFDEENQIKCAEITALRQKIKKLGDFHFSTLLDHQEKLTLDQSTKQELLQTIQEERNDLQSLLDNKTQEIEQWANGFDKLQGMYKKVVEDAQQNHRVYKDRIQKLSNETQNSSEKINQLTQNQQNIEELNRELEQTKQQLENQVSQLNQLIRDNEMKFKKVQKELERQLKLKNSEAMDSLNQLKFKFSKDLYEFIKDCSLLFSLQTPLEENWNLQYLTSNLDSMSSEIFNQLSSLIQSSLEEVKNQTEQQQQQLLISQNSSQSTRLQQQEIHNLNNRLQKLKEEFDRSTRSKQEEIFKFKQDYQVLLDRYHSLEISQNNSIQEKESRISLLKSQNEKQQLQIKQREFELLKKQEQEQERKREFEFSQQKQYQQYQQQLQKQEKQFQELQQQEKLNTINNNIDKDQEFILSIDNFQDLERNQKDLKDLIKNVDLKIKNEKQSNGTSNSSSGSGSNNGKKQKLPRLSQLPKEHIDPNILNQYLSSKQQINSDFLRGNNGKVNDFEKLKLQNLLLYLELKERTSKFNNLVDQFKNFNNNKNQKQQQQFKQSPPLNSSNFKPTSSTSSDRSNQIKLQTPPSPSPSKSTFIPDLKKNQINNKSVFISDKSQINNNGYRYDIDSKEAQNTLNNITNSLKFMEDRIQSSSVN